MNYLSEILAFEQWLETHYLPVPVQLLWYKLMYLCNRSGWSGWMTVDNLRLMAAMQMRREATLIKARDELIKAGLIEYRKGRKGSPNSYHIIPFAERNTFRSGAESVVKEKNTFKNAVQNRVQKEAYPAAENGAQKAAEGADIYKQNRNGNETKTPPLSPAETFCAFWEHFPNKQRRCLAEQAYCRLAASGEIPEADLVKCAQNYAEYVRLTGKKMCFPNNFLENRVFEDYLPGKYRKPDKKPGQKQGFTNFGQREYDYEALEMQLLGGGAKGNENWTGGRGRE